MKKITVILMMILLITGCSQIPNEMERGMELRSKLLQSSQCSFTANITADYGDRVHIFSMDCTSDSGGEISFTVKSPDTISGISGKLTGHGGNLIFDDSVLSFNLLAEDQISPISAPWIFMNTLLSGYMTSACTEDEKIRLSIDENFEEDPLRLDIWLNQENVPQQADILFDGRRIITVSVENFEIL